MSVTFCPDGMSATTTNVLRLGVVADFSTKVQSKNCIWNYHKTVIRKHWTRHYAKPLLPAVALLSVVFVRCHFVSVLVRLLGGSFAKLGFSVGLCGFCKCYPQITLTKLCCQNSPTSLNRFVVIVNVLLIYSPFFCVVFLMMMPPTKFFLLRFGLWCMLVTLRLDFASVAVPPAFVSPMKVLPDVSWMM